MNGAVAWWGRKDRASCEPAMALQIERPSNLVADPRAVGGDCLSNWIADSKTFQQLAGGGGRADRRTADGGSNNPGESRCLQRTGVAFAGQQNISRLRHRGEGIPPELEIVRLQIESQDLIPHGMDLFLLSSEPLDPRREAGLL